MVLQLEIFWWKVNSQISSRNNDAMSLLENFIEMIQTLVMAPSMEWKQKSRAPAPRPNPQCHQEDQDSLAQRLMKSGSCTQIRRPCARRRDVAAKLVVAVIDAGCLASSASKSTLSPARGSGKAAGGVVP